MGSNDYKEELEAEGLQVYGHLGKHSETLFKSQKIKNVKLD